ncbi:MAG: DegT/DnrJ/EryC1/StrS aminotransferase family protein [Leptospiraceae bacterium]|nr:DegT/DnrJ/EryC1/StrS aminotransferase family protein [Leptospiraceae bacterium]MCP5498649.1 DegT/DnrJ/EryC1/StrS aminotransferase family protein [Leptospiraceae bacterium]
MKTIRKTFLPFALPSISEDAIEEVSKVLRSGWVTSGPKVQEFESLFAEYTSAPEAIALNSATAGLHLCLEAIGLTEKDAVFVPAVTFTATAEVACYFKARPVLTDVDPVHNLMSPKTLEEAIERECVQKEGRLYHRETGKLLKAVLPVHLAGYTCDMEGIMEIARRYQLFVIEDAAHAFPAIHKGKMIGTWGDFTVFSFYATKGITTGEGGMVTSPHADYARRIRLMRLHGMNRDSYNRPGWYYEIVEAGFKYNLTDIAAAIGITQLKESDRFWTRRTEIAHTYIEAFSNIPGLKLPSDDENGVHSWHLFRIELDPEVSGVSRDELCEELRKRNIGCSLHFIPLYEHPYYRREFGFNRNDYPNAGAMYEKALSLPLFAGMNGEDVEDVISAVREILLA